ncbi:MAG: hypothetical protein K8R58_09460 [Bacteroidales bacterium]|nr:hypothetical protein [Bacteroidales bacterium]
MKSKSRKVLTFAQKDNEYWKKGISTNHGLCCQIIVLTGDNTSNKYPEELI